MLQSMRNGIFSGFFLIILLLGGIGLVMSDGGGFFRSGIKGTDIAKIGDKNIHIADFDRGLRLALRQQGISSQQAFDAGLVHQFLAQDMNRAAVRQEAKKLGIMISQDNIATFLTGLIDPLLNTGQAKTKEEAFEKILQMSNMSEKDLLEEIQGDRASKVLYQAMEHNPPPLSDELFTALLQFQDQTRTIEFLEFPHDTISGISSPTDTALTSYYESVKSKYALPETRDLSLLIVDADRLKERVDIPASTIQDFYKENIDQFTNPEKREIHQSVFEDEATAHAVLSGFETTLEESVQKVTGDKKSFMGIQSFEKDGLLKDIAEDVFTANTGDLIGPLKTPLGWHVFHLTSIAPPQTLPLEDVTEQIQDTLFQEQMADELYALADELDERLMGGERIEKLTQELPVKHVELQNISSLEGERMSKLSPEDQARVFEVSFQIDEGENTPIEEFSDGRFFTVYVHAIHPSTIPAKDEIQEKLVNAWMHEKKEAKNFVDTQSLLSDLEAKKSNFKAHNPVSQTLSSLDTPPFDLTAHAMDILFSANTGEIKRLKTPQSIILAHIKEINIKPASDIDLSKNKDIKDLLERQSEQELMSAYINHLQYVRKAEINDVLLTQYYGQKDE